MTAAMTVLNAVRSEPSELWDVQPFSSPDRDHPCYSIGCNHAAPGGRSQARLTAYLTKVQLVRLRKLARIRTKYLLRRRGTLSTKPDDLHTTS